MLYDYPKYYEVAFSFRDICREVAFIQSCINKYSQVEVKTILEIACGHAPHAGELSRLNIRYLGLDNNPNMIKYAKEKWLFLDPKPDFIEADMVSFSSKQLFDFVFVMLGSLYLNTTEDMNSHFDSISRSLKSGGLYFLDWCIQFTDPLKHDDSKFSREDKGISIESRFNIRLIDKSENMYEEVWTVDVNDNGSHKQFQMTEHNRAIFPKDFLEFIDNRPDFELVGWWRDWDFGKPIELATPATRPVALLRRK